MSEMQTVQGYELITVVLPQHGRSRAVLDTLHQRGARSIVHFNARGAVLSESHSLISRMFPPPSPKEDIFQVLVPANEAEQVMQEAITAGQLHISGAGAIFSSPCERVEFSENYPLWTKRSDAPVPEVEDEEKRVAVVCIVERGAADPIAKGAILAGSPGPSVYFAEGRGLRDRVRLLRIAKTAEKEIVMVVVEAIDEDLVFSEMSRAGRITEPGRGFIYTVPVTRGLTNITGTESDRKQSASMQEIIRAIDELKGGKEWRGYNPLARAATQKASADKPVLRDLVCLSCVTPRDHSDAIMDAMLIAGAPAASVSHGRLRQPAGEDADASMRLNREWSLIQSIVSPTLVEKLRESVGKSIAEKSISEICLYSSAVPKAQTYLGK